MAGSRLGREIAGVPMLAVTCFGAGLMRPASGTWGSLPPLVMALLMLMLGCGGTDIRVALIVVALAFSFACVKWGKAAEIAFGAKDPSSVVADETAGQAIVLLAVPWGLQGQSSIIPEVSDSIVMWAVAAFLLFRVLDILKPQPAQIAQKLPAGWGILIDDLVAAGYGVGILLGVQLFQGSVR